MKLKVIALLSFSLSPVFAETPQEIIPKDRISVAIGQSQTLKFNSAFKTIAVSSKGTVEAMATTDHIMTITGLLEGEALLTVLGTDGDELYRAIVSVTPEPGHIVRIYDNKSPDYTGFYCTEVHCGRANKELNGAREVSSQTTTAIPGGGVSRTTTFGH